MSESEPNPGELHGLNPMGLLQGAMGAASQSWPAGGPVAWTPPLAEAVAAWFPGFTDVSLIGRGGMGAVYAARQVSLDRKVALKLLPAELSRDPSAAERFRREARALARLSHPHIVAIHDFGETPEGAFFFVMEFVEGADLQHLIREGRLPLAQALEIVRQVCDALEFAHAEGFVHRDIKPANILVDRQGRVKVSDFGLAKILSDHPGSGPEDPQPSLTGGMVGTPDYIAPEQRRGNQPVDHRADIYSLGVMFYEMLTGSVPYGAFAPPSEKAGTGEALDRVVWRAMQEEPDKRYQHASEVRQGVDQAAAPASRRLWWASAAALAVLGIAAVAWGNRSAYGPAVQEPVPGGESGFTNSQGMIFVAAGPPGLWFAAGETRRKDFAAFVQATGHRSAGAVTGVRNGVWQSESASWENPPGLSGLEADHPVVAVSEEDAVSFCGWLTAHERGAGLLAAGERYRLPTTAEWFAAAGHADARVPQNPPSTAPVLAAGAAALPHRVNLTGTGQTPVLRDFDGNVSEWTSTGTDLPGFRIVCGPCWLEELPLAGAPPPARSYERTLRGTGLGFRIVLDRRPSPDPP